MLTERAANLTARIQELASRRRHAQNAKAFRTRADQLNAPAQRLSQLNGVLGLFRERGLVVAMPDEKIQALRAYVEETATAFQADRESILKSDGQRRFSFWEAIAKLPDEIEGPLHEAWAGFIRVTIPSPTPELLTVLARVPAFQAQVNEILGGIRQAEQMKRTLPQSAAAFLHVEELAERMRHALSQLHSDELSSEIMSFLRAVTAGNATLALVTSGVREWLERHNLVTSLKVTL